MSLNVAQVHTYAASCPYQSVRIVQPAPNFTSELIIITATTTLDLLIYFTKVPSHVVPDLIQNHKSYLEEYYHSHSAGTVTEAQTE